ncbi:sulfatase-like hydrolase/transferase [Haloarcula sp. S1CR25-12]|uniref:Sulfatase-like hydrolase/transferase n=1 Tax=Haloarcula saliterrae TaxID=2950534 RepID=A0ABU2FDY4_9EURY|nr:sulfatase-like hydrolase/transferase [Haloarcula sp. S1CR25-12]MDS0260468.1 sulfatase-like hydrolase/transferase [Haloarcula sp. S1CR25-12]
MPADVTNVVLVTIDSLRRDALGGDDSVSPVLDELAAEGVTFESAMAQGNWTPFSFPSVHGSRPVFDEGPDIGVASTPTLAEQLSEAGLRTGGFNAANGFLTDHWGYDRGFDEFDPFVEGSGFLAAHPTIQAWVQLGTSPFRRAASVLGGGDDERPFADVSRMGELEDHATEFLETADDGFFLWVHYMDTHTPYVPAPRHLREVSDTHFGLFRMLGSHFRTGMGWDVDERTLGTLRTLYDGTVRQVDESVGRLCDTLDSEGVADETAIVVAGDHGEEFLDHGHLSHYPKLYRELIDVPLFLTHPDGESGTVHQPVGLDTIPPTVCDLLGVEPADAWEGQSVAPALDGEAIEDRGPVVSVAVRGDSVTTQPIPRHREDGELLVSARDARWTYIEHTDTGHRELYDRRTDPEERRDLCADGTDDAAPPPVLDRLSAAVADHVERLDTASEGAEERQTGGESDEITARLKALGYK